MRDVLQAKGFDTSLYAENVTKTDFKKMIKRFGTKIATGGVGLFYFAGHGLQVGGRNFLMATDSRADEEDDVEFESIALEYITKKMQRACNRFNVIILDACRNNPFKRGGDNGLAPVGNARGIFVAYATEAGKSALDGSGEHGIFTKHLIDSINRPVPIEQVFKQTREAVYAQTNHQQFPGVYNQSMGGVLLHPSHIHPEHPNRPGRCPGHRQGHHGVPSRAEGSAGALRLYRHQRWLCQSKRYGSRARRYGLDRHSGAQTKTDRLKHLYSERATHPT